MILKEIKLDRSHRTQTVQQYTTTRQLSCSHKVPCVDNKAVGRFMGAARRELAEGLGRVSRESGGVFSTRFRKHMLKGSCLIR